MPDFLVVSPEPPWPLAGGGPMRTASLLHYLAERGAVDLILFAEEGANDPARAVPAGLIRRADVIRLPRHSRTSLARAGRNALRYLRGTAPLVDRFAGLDAELAEVLAGRSYSFTILEHFWVASYVTLVEGHCGNVWLDLHNIESAWHETLAAAETGAVRIALSRFASACAGLERRLLPQFSGILVASSADADRIRDAAPRVRTVVYPNALPRMERPARTDDNAIIFTGNMEYAPNANAVAWFARDIWPELRRSCPGLVWRIAGKHADRLRSIVSGDGRIELIPRMEDPGAELARARVAVVPLLAGSGTRFKILEAWAAGTPVISTAIGAEGLAAEHGKNILIADSAGKMRETIVSLLASEIRRSEIGDAGRALYEERYIWPAAWQALAGVVC